MAIAHPSGQLHELVWTAIRTFDAHPNADQDEMLAALEAEDLLPETAWALYQLVPAAVTHACLRPKGVKFPTEFLEVDDVNNIGGARRRNWTDEPLYVSALEVVEHLLVQEINSSALVRASMHCAEMDVICQLTSEGSEASDLVFTETLLMSYSAWDRVAADMEA